MKKGYRNYGEKERKCRECVKIWASHSIVGEDGASCKMKQCIFVNS
jgi:hypothetical protein